ncbi:Exoglucanase [Dactylellina cionopaga]|nr:Exoglucanase [Dactylellina cionopaga]
MTTPTTTATITLMTTPTTTQTTTRTTTTATRPLDVIMKSRGKVYVGFAADVNQFSDSQVSPILRTEGGCLTPINAMTWELTEPLQSNWYFTTSDAFLTFALQNNKLVRGFPLIWHNKLPPWIKSITNRNVLTAAIQNHVAALMTRYRGYVYAWDVASEVISDTGGMRPSVFSQVFGDYTFLDVAFNAAKAADPKARLCLNENYIDYPGTKLTAFINLVKDLRSRGVPIDCVGTQTHTEVGFGGIPYFETTLQMLSGTGCEIQVTQLDIAFAGTAPSSSAMLAQQSVDYRTIVGACMRTPACSGITTLQSFWGVTNLPVCHL